MELLSAYGKIGPNRYKPRYTSIGARVPFEVIVLTPAGEMGDRSGCYAELSMMREGELYATDNGSCKHVGAFDGVAPGQYAIIVNVVTDWGATGKDQREIVVEMGRD